MHIPSHCLMGGSMLARSEPRLLLEGGTRDLAMFNLANDSKPRGCDIVALKVEDVAPNGHAIDRCFAI
jgi:hypothetical protein